MATPWTVDDTGPEKGPWTVDDTAGEKGPWTIDDVSKPGKKPLRGQSGGVNEDASYLGALVEPVKQMLPSLAGGMIESAGDILKAQPTQLITQQEPMGMVDAAKSIYARLKSELPQEGVVGTTVGLATMPARLGHQAAQEISARVLPDEFKPFGEQVSQYGAEIGDVAREKIRKATPEDLNWVQQAGISATQSLAQTAPLFLASRFGVVNPEKAGAAILGSFGATSFAQSYNEGKAKGLPPEAAFQNALPQALVEMGTEKMALDTLLKGGAGWFTKFLAQEVGSEEVATIAQSMLEKGIVDPEKWSSMGEAWKDMAITALAAGMGAGALKTMDYGTQKALDTYNKGKVERVEEEQGAAREKQRAFEDYAKGQMEAAGTIPPGSPPIEDVLAEMAPTRQVPQADGSVLEVPFVPTAEELALAEIQRVQHASGLDLPKTEEGVRYAEELTTQLGQSSLLNPELDPYAYGAETERQMDATLAAVAPEGMLDTGGVSPAVQQRRREEPALQRTVPTAEAPIIWAQDGRAVGLTLSQTGAAPLGSVTIVGEKGAPGEDNENATVHMPTAEAIGNLYLDWVKRFMPEARIVLEFTKLPEDSFGNARVVTHEDGSTTHVINLMDMANLVRHGKSDPRTSLNLIGAASHEFGHALQSQALIDGLKGKMSPFLLGELARQAKTGKISDRVLEAVRASSPVETALLKEWQGLREAVLNGTMTAVEFMEQWAGLRKVGGSILQAKKNQSLYKWAEERTGKRLEGMTALELVLSPLLREGASKRAQQAYLNEYLSLAEYMAEQHSKYAYASGDIQQSGFAKLFQTMAARLKQLFIQLKTWKGVSGETIIKPGTSYAEWIDSLTARAKETGWKDTPFQLSPALMKKQREIVKKAGLKALERNEARQKKAKKKKEEKLEKELYDILNPKPSPPGQVTPTREEKGSQAELKAETENMLDQLFVADLVSVKMEERYRDMIQRGDVQSVHEKLAAMMAKRGMADRDYTSKVLQKLPNKEKIKAETLQALMKMADVKAQERAMWDRFLQAHPNGFSIEEAKAAVTANVVPLEPSFTGQFSDVGVSVLGNLAYPNATSVVWEGPIQTEGSNHFPGHHNYVMHSRRVDAGGERWILELQSDLFQKLDQIFPADATSVTEEMEAETEAAEHVQLLIDELEESIADNDPKIYLDAGSLRSIGYSQEVAENLMRSRDQQKILQSLQFYKFTIDARVRALKEQEARLAMQGPLEQLRESQGNWWERLIKEEIAEASVDGQTTIYFPSAAAVAEIEGWDMTNEDVYNRVKGIYTRYASVIPKYLKSKFKAVEITRENHTWYAVDPTVQGENIVMYDRDNPYSSRNPRMVLDELAGLTDAEYRQPERIAEAQSFWNRLGTDSPYFKRWWGNSQIVDQDGQPKKVWRGTGNPVAFLDPTTRGGLTGVNSAKKAFWFSDNRENAEFYASRALEVRSTVLREDLRRDAQKLRRSIEQAKDLLQIVPKDELDKQRLLRGVLERDQAKLRALTQNEGNTVPAAATVREHYLKMENPLVTEGLAYGSPEWDQVLVDAQAGGFDGVVYKNAYDPYHGTVYAVFEPEQVKADSNMRTYDPTDNLHWDRDSPLQEGHRIGSKIVQDVWDETKLRAGNSLAWAQDQLVQLQQVAAAQPNDPTLKGFMRVKTEAEGLKNKLMGKAEDTAKRLMSVTGSSDALRKQLHSILKEEWKSGVLHATLVGKDAYGEVIWGGELGDTGKEQRMLVSSWEVEDGLGLRSFLEKQGVDVTSETGQHIIEMYLATRNTFMQEFTELGKALKAKADKAYLHIPLVRATEYAAIDDLTFKQLASPFVPSGNFGNWVVIVKRGLDTVKVVHYENEAAYDKGYREALALARNDPKINVKGKHLNDEERGMVLPLPKDFFEKAIGTGEFTDEQIELMRDLLQVGKYDKINERFEKLSEQIEGNNDDFARVFADFAWHNSNYIWKLKYRAKFQDVLKAGRKAIREVEKARDIPVEEQTAILKQLRRNQRLMDNQMNYVLKPQDEYQTARGYISLAYLAFGVKTAVMNLSTNLNTLAAVTEEYGMGQGTKHYGKTLAHFWTVWNIASRRAAGEVVELTPEQEKAGLEPLIWAMGKAQEEGIIDQSFAYFLAGMSNSSAFMRAVQKNNVSAIAARALEYGMLPFQTIEKFNRIVALQTFMSAGVEENAREGGWRTFPVMYEKAARRVDQTQNAYDPANRAKILQGKKAILTMFMSYTLFQGHIMTGGLHRAIKADISAENEQRAARGLPLKELPNVFQTSTMKLWIMYGLLAGGAGLPFAENILDVFRFLWKKFFPREDAEVELRKFLEGMGADPNLVLHGVTHNLGSLLGFGPFDVSGSLGLGRLIPGTNMLGANFKNKDEIVGKLGMTIAGPAGSFLGAVAQATMELGQGNVLEAGKAMPGATGAVSKAIDAWVAQTNRPTYGVTTKSGVRMTLDPETGEYRDLTTSELVGMAFGFTPTMTKLNREANFRITNEVMYWQIRRNDLLDKYREARVTQDDVGRASVMEEINRYNREAPSPKMRISGKTLSTSMKTWKKGNQVAEKYGTRIKGMRDTAEQVRDAYLGGEE